MFANGRCRAWLLILLGRVSPVSGNFQSRKTGTKPPMFFFTLPSLRFFVPFDPVVRLFFARFKCSLEKRNVDRIVDSFRYSNRAPFLGNGLARLKGIISTSEILLLNLLFQLYTMNEKKKCDIT